MTDNVLLERDDARVTITLNRPDKLNALDADTATALLAIEEELRTDPCRVVVVRGAGRAFCAGADLAYVQTIRHDPSQVRAFLDLLHDAVSGLGQLPQVVVGAVHGLALAGGFELLMGCDIVVVERSARLGDQHANFGLIPGAGGTQRLPRLVGPARAKDLLFTGRWLSGDEAHAIGLVARVSDDLDKDVAALADELASRSPTAAAAVKRLAQDGLDMSLEEGLALEIEAAARHFASRDMAIGLEAFEQRTTPVFPDREVG